MKNISLFTLVFILSVTSSIAQDQNFHLNKTYDIGSEGTLYLSADDAEVKIYGEDRNDVLVKIDYLVTSKGIEWGDREFKIEVTNQGENLLIKEFKTGNRGMIGYARSEYTIEIRAPYSVGLDINGDDDTYQINSINGGISINADDADVTLKNCKGDNFYFDLDDGDVKMDQGRGQLTVRIDDGDIEIINGSFSEIDFRGDDGNMAIETSIAPNALFKFNGDDSNFDMVVTQGGGTFTIDHDNGRISYDNNFRLMDKDEDRTTLSLTGGRAKILFSGDDIRVSLTSVQSN